jgi:hypothetical protein
MTPEGKVKKVIKETLQEYGVYYHMPVQNGMGKPTLDFICCIPVRITPEMVGETVGLYLGIEAKAEGEKPTLRQENTMKDIEQAHGLTIVIAGEAAAEDLAAWLESFK